MFQASQKKPPNQSGVWDFQCRFSAEHGYCCVRVNVDGKILSGGGKDSEPKLWSPDTL